MAPVLRPPLPLRLLLALRLLLQLFQVAPAFGILIRAHAADRPRRRHRRIMPEAVSTTTEAAAAAMDMPIMASMGMATILPSMPNISTLVGSSRATNRITPTPTSMEGILLLLLLLVRMHIRSIRILSTGNITDMDTALAVMIITVIMDMVLVLLQPQLSPLHPRDRRRRR